MYFQIDVQFSLKPNVCDQKSAHNFTPFCQSLATIIYTHLKTLMIRLTLSTVFFHLFYRTGLGEVSIQYIFIEQPI